LLASASLYCNNIKGIIMQLSEKLLDKPVSELSVKELLSLIGRNEDIQSSAIENEQKLFDDEEWIRGWKDLAKFCDRSVPTVRSWYKQGLLDKATRKIGAFYLFNKEWLRQNLL
jgi:hypothetical protein